MTFMLTFPRKVSEAVTQFFNPGTLYRFPRVGLELGDIAWYLADKQRDRHSTHHSKCSKLGLSVLPDLQSSVC